MFVVRFVALAALALWLGGMVAPIWLTGSVPADLGRQTRTLGYICGGLVLIALFVLKFVGPPPRWFPLRAGTVALMLALLAATQVMRIESGLPAMINLALSLVLLSWYARE